MRDDDGLTEFERRLRGVLRPDDERVGSVISRALAAQPEPRSRSRGGMLAAAAAALIVLAAIVWRSSAPPSPVLTISGAGSVIVVVSEDGRRWVVDGRAAPETRGQYVIAISH